MSIASDKNDSKIFLSSSIHNDLVSTLNIKHVRKKWGQKRIQRIYYSLFLSQTLKNFFFLSTSNLFLKLKLFILKEMMLGVIVANAKSRPKMNR